MTTEWHEQIKVRSYFIWEDYQRRGLPDLGPWAKWFEAELEERPQLDQVNHPPLKHDGVHPAIRAHIEAMERKQGKRWGAQYDDRPTRQ